MVDGDEEEKVVESLIMGLAEDRRLSDGRGVGNGEYFMVLPGEGIPRVFVSSCISPTVEDRRLLSPGVVEGVEEANGEEEEEKEEEEEEEGDNNKGSRITKLVFDLIFNFFPE